MLPLPAHTSLCAINLRGRYEPEQCRMTGCLSVCWRYTRYHRNNTTTICPRGSRSMPEVIAVLPTHDRTVATSKTVQNNKVTIVSFVMQTRFINWIYLRHHLWTSSIIWAPYRGVASAAEYRHSLYTFLNIKYHMGKFYDWKSSKAVSKVIVILWSKAHSVSYQNWDWSFPLLTASRAVWIWSKLSRNKTR